MYLLARPPVQPQVTQSTCPAAQASAPRRLATVTSSSTITLPRQYPRTTRTG